MTQEQHYEAVMLSDKKIEERIWRDKELKKTDWICAIPDHGLHASYMTYRTLLRDWPSTSDFPDTKPTI
jgi:hypothetical protein